MNTVIFVSLPAVQVIVTNVGLWLGIIHKSNGQHSFMWRPIHLPWIKPVVDG